MNTSVSNAIGNSSRSTGTPNFVVETVDLPRIVVGKGSKNRLIRRRNYAMQATIGSLLCLVVLLSISLAVAIRHRQALPAVPQTTTTTSSNVEDTFKMLRMAMTEMTYADYSERFWAHQNGVQMDYARFNDRRVLANERPVPFNTFVRLAISETGVDPHLVAPHTNESVSH